MRTVLAVMLAAVACGAFERSASAQTSGPVPIIIGERSVLHSTVLGEDRTVAIYRPAGYAGSPARYPVLYLLDGEGHFHHASGIVAFLAANGRMPPVIVVGIGNTDRTRDLSPPTTDTTVRPGDVGGADRFLRFISDELIPHIDSTHRTVPYRVLAGHSLGGLLALHAFSTRPDLFQGYIAISPSLWWSGQALVSGMPAFLAAHPDLKASLYITTGDEGGEMLSSTRRLAEVLRVSAPRRLEWTFRHMPEESHGSIPHRALYDGLESMFADMRREADSASRTVADLERRHAGLSEKYGYTLRVAEAEINLFGYSLLARGLNADAIAVFTANTERYPESANTYDSLGDAQAAAGRLEEARRAWTRAVALARRHGDPVLATSRAKLAGLGPAPAR